jgi:hypothetical protein
MGKHDFTKVMRNIDVSPTDRTARPTRTRESYQMKIDLLPNDKLRLLNVMRIELNYYNNLNDVLSSKARISPVGLINFTNEWVQLFGHLAYEGININRLHDYRTDKTKIPESLEPFNKLLTGLDSAGKRLLTDSHLIILEAASGRGNIGLLHPEVRRIMATEMFKHYLEQSKVMTQAVPKSQREEFSHRSAMPFLENMDEIRKRHVQLPRKVLSVKWDVKEEATVIRTPYTSRPIVLENFNLSEPGWNILILHQQPGTMITKNSAWVADFKRDSSGYMIKYVDQSSAYAGSAYHQAKRDRFGAN